MIFHFLFPINLHFCNKCISDALIEMSGLRLHYPENPVVRFRQSFLA